LTMARTLGRFGPASRSISRLALAIRGSSCDRIAAADRLSLSLTVPRPWRTPPPSASTRDRAAGTP
jgi:hypothetical protein